MGLTIDDFERMLADRQRRQEERLRERRAEQSERERLHAELLLRDANYRLRMELLEAQRQFHAERMALQRERRAEERRRQEAFWNSPEEVAKREARDAARHALRAAGVTPGRVWRLLGADILSVEALRRATDQELLAIPTFGPAVVKQLRAKFPALPLPAWVDEE